MEKTKDKETEEWKQDETKKNEEQREGKKKERKKKKRGESDLEKLLVGWKEFMDTEQKDESTNGYLARVEQTIMLNLVTSMDRQRTKDKEAEEMKQTATEVRSKENRKIYMMQRCRGFYAM